MAGENLWGIAKVDDKKDHLEEDIKVLRKRLMFRSGHRGLKEMDLLLGNFVKKHLDQLNNSDLLELEKLLLLEDEILSKWQG